MPVFFFGRDESFALYLYTDTHRLLISVLFSLSGSLLLLLLLCLLREDFDVFRVEIYGRDFIVW